MTCIVGLVDKGEVLIGGDSAGVNCRSLAMQVRSDHKIFRNGPFLMGFTSSFRMGQLLRFSFNPPKRHTDIDVYAYMVTDFVDAVRDCLKDGGYAERYNDVERGGEFLVGYEGRLFRIESGYEVGETVYGYDAVGCGEDIALGSLCSTAGGAPKDRIHQALKAAAQFSAGVSAPFHIVGGADKEPKRLGL